MLIVLPNDSAHRWRPLRGSRIAKLRGGAAIRCSAWFGFPSRFHRPVGNREEKREIAAQRGIGTKSLDGLLRLRVHECVPQPKSGTKAEDRQTRDHQKTSRNGGRSPPSPQDRNLEEQTNQQRHPDGQRTANDCDDRLKDHREQPVVNRHHHRDHVNNPTDREGYEYRKCASHGLTPTLIMRLAVRILKCG